MKKSMQLSLLLIGFIFTTTNAQGQCYADLGIVVTANYKSCVGSQVLLSVSLTNSDAGSRTATATVAIPTGLEYVSSHTTGGSYNESTGEWSKIYFAQDQRAINLFITCKIKSASVANVNATITNTDGTECYSNNNTFSYSFPTIGTCDNDNDGLLDQDDRDDDNDGVMDELEYTNYITPTANLLANNGSDNSATSSLVSAQNADYANANNSETQVSFLGDPYHNVKGNSNWFLVKRNETNSPVKVWEQTISNLKNKVSYVLVFYTSNVSNPWTNPGSNPKLSIKQDGQVLENNVEIRDDFEIHNGTDGWDRHEFQFVPNYGTNAATLSICNDFSSNVSNQFALTAFQVYELPYSAIGGDPMIDTDKDSILNYRDINFCGLNEKHVSTCMDLDGDGIVNQFDNDADNDGVSDLIEFGGTDANGDGLTDATYTDDNKNGMADVFEGLNTNGMVFLDFDGDGLRNGWDLDSDNDGISDEVEIQANSSKLNIKTFADANNDGMADGYAVGDIDHDGLLASMDLDCDGDGMTDLDETIGGTTDESGMIEGNKITDANLNGWSDLVDGSKGSLNGIFYSDNDNDGHFNFQDADADGDGIADNIEMQESEGYVKLVKCLDLDGDGLSNQWDSDTINKGGNGLFSLNMDIDFVADFLDMDTDNDSIADWIEAVDMNGDHDATPELLMIARQYVVLGGNPTHYPTGARSSNVAWLVTNTNGTPAFLNPMDAYYHDSDNDGLIDLFDEDNNGISMDMADAEQNGIADWRERGQRGGSGMGGALPVTLVKFGATLLNNNTNLAWQTASEKDIESYEVERSLDGVTFEYIGSNKAFNSNSLTDYAMIDPAVNELFTSVIYYRLKINEADGSSHYSQVVMVQVQNPLSIGFMNVYPVPAQENINIQFVASADTKVQIQLDDMGGKTVMTETRTASKGQNTMQFNNISNIAAGTYILTLNGEGVQMQTKIQKN